MKIELKEMKSHHFTMLGLILLMTGYCGRDHNQRALFLVRSDGTWVRILLNRSYKHGPPPAMSLYWVVVAKHPICALLTFVYLCITSTKWDLHYLPHWLLISQYRQWEHFPRFRFWLIGLKSQWAYLIINHKLCTICLWTHSDGAHGGRYTLPLPTPTHPYPYLPPTHPYPYLPLPTPTTTTNNGLERSQFINNVKHGLERSQFINNVKHGLERSQWSQMIGNV